MKLKYVIFIAGIVVSMQMQSRGYYGDRPYSGATMTDPACLGCNGNGKPCPRYCKPNGNGAFSGVRGERPYYGKDTYKVSQKGAEEEYPYQSQEMEEEYPYQSQEMEEEYPYQSQEMEEEYPYQLEEQEQY
jgi:hypothetical protein